MNVHVSKSKTVRIAIIGAAGHGGVVFDAASRSADHHIVGFLDSGKLAGSEHMGVPVQTAPASGLAYNYGTKSESRGVDLL